MAVEDGIALKKFGTDTVTGWIVNEITEDTSGEDTEVPDEDGDVVTHINSYGIKTVVTFDLIPKSATAIPEIGDTFTYTSGAHGAQKITVLSVGNKQVIKGVLKLSITGNRYPDITLT